MENYRDALKLSAKAAGIMGLEYRHGSDAYYFDCPETGRAEWNPPEDDGQTLRLAGALEMTVITHCNQEMVCTRDVHCRAPSVILPWGDDRMAAVREAVFLLAVAIGKAMP